MAGLNDLWGGSLEVVSLDPVRFVVRLDITVAGTEVARHTLKVRGVTEIHLSNSISLPCTYAELTEIRAIALSNQRARLEMILWSEDAPVTIEGDSIELDGTRLKPDVGTKKPS